MFIFSAKSAISNSNIHTYEKKKKMVGSGVAATATLLALFALPPVTYGKISKKTTSEETVLHVSFIHILLFVTKIFCGIIFCHFSTMCSTVLHVQQRDKYKVSESRRSIQSFILAYRTVIHTHSIPTYPYMHTFHPEQQKSNILILSNETYTSGT